MVARCIPGTTGFEQGSLSHMKVESSIVHALSKEALNGAPMRIQLRRSVRCLNLTMAFNAQWDLDFSFLKCMIRGASTCPCNDARFKSLSVHGSGKRQDTNCSDFDLDDCSHLCGDLLYPETSIDLLGTTCPSHNLFSP